MRTKLHIFAFIEGSTFELDVSTTSSRIVGLVKRLSAGGGAKGIAGQRGFFPDANRGSMQVSAGNRIHRLRDASSGGTLENHAGQIAQLEEEGED